MSRDEPPTTIRSWQMSKAAANGSNTPAPGEWITRDIPVPGLKDGEALVEISGCGVCGTDLGYFYDGIPTVSRPPLILGHEISGTVVAGDAAWLGREVIVPTIIPCRECELCRSGRANRCVHQKMPGYSYGVYGGFASHIPVPARELCAVPQRKGFALEQIPGVAAAVATPYQAALRGSVAAGDRVIIIGVTGGLGIFMAQWAKHLGAETVIGLGRNSGKLQRALEFGVDVTINAFGKSPADVKKEFFTQCRRYGLGSKHGWEIFEVTGSGSRPGGAARLLRY